MTPRKELFIEIKKALQVLSTLELVDLQRGQMDNPEGNYPDIWTAALIEVLPINFATMTEHKQEANCEVNIDFYCKDGWMDQHLGTADLKDGLIEIDVLDEIANTLQFLKGEQFKPLQQTGESALNVNEEGIMSYRLSFSTLIYKRTPYPYVGKKINLTTP